MKGIRVLEVDPDLARDLDASQAAVARQASVAAVLELARGSWTPPPLPSAPPGPIGLLVVEGLLERHVELAGIGCAELLGKGDLLHPWERDEGQPSLPFTVAWSVLEPTRLAVLDGAFAEAIAGWPTITMQLFARSAQATQSLAVHFAITCFVGLELRLFILLWHLADRFGHVESDGVVVPLRLTHNTLARLVRARRPSVTASVNALADRGVVTRGDDGSWLLHGDPAEEFARLRAKVTPDELDQRGEPTVSQSQPEGMLAGPVETATETVRQLFRRDT